METSQGDARKQWHRATLRCPSSRRDEEGSTQACRRPLIAPSLQAGGWIRSCATRMPQPGFRRWFKTHTITLHAAHSLRSTMLRCHACNSHCRPLPGLSSTHTHYNDRLTASRAGFPGLAAHFRWLNVLADNALNVVSYASVVLCLSGSGPAPRVPTRDQQYGVSFRYAIFLDG